MLISAIITAIDVDNGTTKTFGASIIPPRVGDIIVYNDKEWVVTKSKQRIGFGQTQGFSVTMEHKVEVE